MRAKNKAGTMELPPHSQRVLALLQESKKPLSAYEILDSLRDAGIKAPPTVYRALDVLIARGLAHRIESLNAFIACDDHEENHAAQFAVCRDCGTVTEIHDHRLTQAIGELARHIKFRIEREMLELLGVCVQCDKRRGASLHAKG